jgi:hypothetical protein
MLDDLSGITAQGPGASKPIKDYFSFFAGTCRSNPVTVAT